MTDRLVIQLLGEFRVSVGPRTIAEREWRLRKAKSLVKLRALAPHRRLHRERIVDRLWPEMGPEDGANNWPRTVSTVSCRRPTRTPRWLLALCLAGLLLMETITRVHSAAAYCLVCAPQLSAGLQALFPASRLQGAQRFLESALSTRPTGRDLTVSYVRSRAPRVGTIYRLFTVPWQFIYLSHLALASADVVYSSSRPWMAGQGIPSG